VRRTFVGGRSLIPRVGGLGQLRLGPDESVGQFRDLARELEDDAVLLFHVPLQESEAFLEGALVIIHVGKMEADLGRARRYGDADS
jgi:hypothetical protein